MTELTDSAITFHEEEEDYCPICRSSMTWTECWNCGGAGWYSRYDEDPLWYSEDDDYECGVCLGNGGWYACPYADEHPEAEVPHD